MVQDKDENNGGKPIGSFLAQFGDHQSLQCGGRNGGITHAQKFARRGQSVLSSIDSVWQAPNNAPSSVMVRATVLYEYSRAGHARKTVSL